MSKNDIFKEDLSSLNQSIWANKLYRREDIIWYSHFNRFGVLDPYNGVGRTKEYLFFTKPDLNLVKPGTDTLNPELKNQPFFNDLIQRYPEVIGQLQASNGIGDKGPFMAVLSNAVKNTLELQSISATEIDTGATIYGTNYTYRGWGFDSDEGLEFSLEFEDTRYLEIYNLLKAYEEYERLKHIGLVTPPNINNAPVVDGKCFSYYIENKILHDQFSIYKFIVDEDGETILYYAKLWGVYFKNVPRDAFSDLKEGGLTYAVEFKAAFIDDMNPLILSDFNDIVMPQAKKGTELPLYNTNLHCMDGRWARIPYVAKVEKSKSGSAWNNTNKMKYMYKLKWRV